MKLESLWIENFKSFNQRQRIDLDDYITVLVGRNNAGKSAALEALSLRATQKPHRSESTIPMPGDNPPGRSQFSARMRLSRQSFAELLRSVHSFEMPVPKGQSPTRGAANALLARILGKGGYIRALREGSKYFFDDEKYMGAYKYDARRNATMGWYQFGMNAPDNSPTYKSHRGGTESDESLQRWVFNRFVEGIYIFSAERMNIGLCESGPSLRLSPDGGNLPEVLSQLAQNQVRMDRYIEHVRRVLPHVTRVSAPAVSRDHVQALIWHGPENSERQDLAVPLKESGTGISQVLCLLYVILDRSRDRTILIDEPSSFLHPGAVSSLMEIIRENSRHQYVIATHSPAVVVGSRSPTVYLFSKSGRESTLEKVSPEDVIEQRRILDAVGSSLSEVFGPSGVLWVEGKTEQRCFPLIVSDDSFPFPHGAVFRSVVNTGDFKGKRSDLVVEIYRRLSASVGLIPPALGFLFDSEGISDREKQRLRDKCGESLNFIPANMFEAYLIMPAAIATVMRKNGCDISEDEVCEWFQRRDMSEVVDRPGDIPHQMDAAKVLSELFWELSSEKGSPMNYEKVFHGEQLTKAILDADRSRFDEVRRAIEAALAGS